MMTWSDSLSGCHFAWLLKHALHLPRQLSCSIRPMFLPALHFDSMQSSFRTSQYTTYILAWIVPCVLLWWVGSHMKRRYRRGASPHRAIELFHIGESSLPVLLHDCCAHVHARQKCLQLCSAAMHLSPVSPFGHSHYSAAVSGCFLGGIVGRDLQWASEPEN